ncbi:MARVEL domain-containing protein [Aspergillus puulaauensis]|uniref:MARVEL domain-containing protein n=1 Tax=Aspergillus puulaauensis TaxID=1220207 RepID=A0A7R7XNS8_9EURO|nr:uncharacterized protein APUU_41395S [Aspergillus puulaauensis]BCS24951.1 hypothetical protein APUU_41395S [Aspergillus puulaauensis]
MARTVSILTEAQLNFFIICNRVIQWVSAVVVLGITSSFIHTGPRGLTITYVEIIAVVSVAVFIPSFVSPWLSTPAKDFVLFIDIAFSYLWLTAFIFSAVDCNQKDCHLNAPPGVSCSKKWANEAFIFLTFIFTFFALFIETYTLWLERRDRKTPLPVHEKHHSQASSAPLHQDEGPESHTYPAQRDQAYPHPGSQANPTLGNQTYPAPGNQAYPPAGNQTYSTPGSQPYSPPGQQTYPAQEGQGYSIQGSQATEVHTVGAPQAA